MTNMKLGFTQKLFSKIAEPRVFRVFQFIIYVLLILAGSSVLLNDPKTLRFVVGPILLGMFGIFITLGGLLGAIAVLPGIWWLERVAILILVPGIAMFIVMIYTIDATNLNILISIAFLLTFVQRWFEINEYQLAPKKE